MWRATGGKVDSPAMTNSDSPAHGSGPGAAAATASTPTNSPRTATTGGDAAAKHGTTKYDPAIESDAPRHVAVPRSMYPILVGIFTGVLLISK